jgi:hypothetical protein
MATLWGILFLTGGILGFVPGITEHEMFLGFFMVNTPHNILHITTGMSFLLAAAIGIRAARAWFRLFGIFYSALGVVGFVVGNNLILGLISNSVIDSWGHLFLGLVLILLGRAWPDRR